ncbi:hypothetical protein NC653_034026 [Populus alba x Populus x berolinensis]|uniref:Reverse transcriptase zinc-binding domain-containing protein n=2 Tax=Populus TaxID=3689 RepID=A0A4U5PMU7_POPAL|nr:hypothetical protein NC653_034026 [Populus alba x Populus x berolinensis]TKR97766.1 hypothetical protein D5086_0000209660 [Populus alba]
MDQLLWFKGHIPQQSFILWLAGLGRLCTMDYLHSAGIIRNAAYMLCGFHIETHELSITIISSKRLFGSQHYDTRSQSPQTKALAPFKFLNLWADREDFMDIVGTIWQPPISGNPVYAFTTKLLPLKNAFKSLHRHHTSHISCRVIKAKARWTSAQTSLDDHPGSANLITAERN